jgi:hypothetical protein
MISILLITTNSPKRFFYLEKNILSIEGCLVASNNAGIEKIISVDILEEHSEDISEILKYEKLGWKVIADKGGSRDGMAKNQLRGLSLVTNEWVLYSEDDISFRRIIDFQNLNKILTKETGFISNTGFINDVDSVDISKYINNHNNYRIISNDIFLKKDKNLFEKKWFLNFPSCYIRTDHFKELLNNAMNTFSEKQISIEEGISISWFDFGYANNYESFCFLNNSLDFNKIILKNEIEKNAAINYWNNDESTRIPSVNNKKSMWF